MWSTILGIRCWRPKEKEGPPKSYNGSKVLQVPLEASNLLKHYQKTGDVEVWGANGTHCELFVIARALIDVRNILDKNHVIYTVLTENVQEAINKENYNKTLVGFRSRQKGKKMSWNAYHRLKDIYEFTDQLAKDYPHRVRVVNIGKSVQGRQLKVAIFKTGIKNAKRIWLDGGIHAREWISPAVVTYVMRKLAKIKAPNNDPLSQIDFYVCPLVNPDGYEYSHTTDRLWRKNRYTKNPCRGVDLNRNFNSSNWKPSKKCDGQHPGSSALSEPESRNMANFIMKNKKNMEGFISFHSYAQAILYPYAHRSKSRQLRTPQYRAIVETGSDMADEINKVDGHVYKPMAILEFADGAYGSSVDWAMDIGITYPYAIELRPGSSSDQPAFMLPANEIIPTAKESLAAITALATAILKKR